MQPGPSGDSAISLDFIPSTLTRSPERTYPNNEGVDEMTSQATACAVDLAERRRSSRLHIRVALVVCGQSPEQQYFQEETTTLSINAHGALVPLATEVTLGQRLLILNPHTWNERAGRVTRLGSLEGGRTEVGIEFPEAAPEFWPECATQENVTRLA
jgi:hypothetical protein